MKKAFRILLPVFIIAAAFVYGCSDDDGTVNTVASDNSIKWMGLNVPLDTNGYTPVFIDQFVIAPNNDLYLVTDRYERLYKSSDTGHTWQMLNYPVVKSTPDVNSLMNVLYFSPNGEMFTFIMTDVISNKYLLFRSPDGGQTWESIQNPIHTYITGLIFNSNGTVFISGFNGIFYSSDNGSTWSAPVFQDSVYNIAVTPNGALFAGTVDRGLLRTTNNGSTWDTVNAGLGVFPGPAYKTPAILGVAPSGNIYAGKYYGYNFSSSIQIGYGGGLYRSSDGGTTWHEADYGMGTGAAISLVFFLKNGTFMANSGSAFYNSSDGAIWFFDDLTYSGDFFQMDSNQYLYTAGTGNIWRTVKPLY